jgi:hypothetical protein
LIGSRAWAQFLIIIYLTLRLISPRFQFSCFDY